MLPQKRLAKQSGRRHKKLTTTSRPCHAQLTVILPQTISYMGPLLKHTGTFLWSLNWNELVLSRRSICRQYLTFNKCWGSLTDQHIRYVFSSAGWAIRVSWSNVTSWLTVQWSSHSDATNWYAADIHYNPQLPHSSWFHSWIASRPAHGLALSTVMSQSSNSNCQDRYRVRLCGIMIWQP